ncbi:Sodium-coupled monocarboxylate transporter 1 [Clonorchis sinensis]|uniref:Sodium-coupled monocarboxylate transporter 1 n=1 Tax=Clonorchis sinensis TaxID=79923 RepID=A0A3R7EUS1_CLOSI|nr:Sodium-coupled monocarboxylate transporter 1 [Clonorchis sinensis]
MFAFWLLVYLTVGLYQRFRTPIRKQLNQWFRRKQQHDQVKPDDVETLLLGNRQLSLFPIVSSIMASFLSAISLLGTTTEAYVYGIEFICMILAYSIAFPLAAEIYMPVYYKLRLTSAYESLEIHSLRVSLIALASIVHRPFEFFLLA